MNCGPLPPLLTTHSSLRTKNLLHTKSIHSPGQARMGFFPFPIEVSDWRCDFTRWKKGYYSAAYCISQRDFTDCDKVKKGIKGYDTYHIHQFECICA